MAIKMNQIENQSDEKFMILVSLFNYSGLSFSFDDHVDVLREIIERLHSGKLKEHKIEIINILTKYMNNGDTFYQNTLIDSLIVDILNIIKNS